MIKLEYNGKPLEEGVNIVIGNVIKALFNKKNIQDSLLHTTKNWLLSKKSAWFSPSKVKASSDQSAIYINIPGITRAYHDIDIYPKKSKYLSIPIHRSAYGLSPRSFSDLFPIQTKKGSLLLANDKGGQLTFMYSLVKKVHQRQDSSLLPSDDNYAYSIFNRISNNIRQYG